MVAAKFEIDVAGKTKADILKDLENFLFALSTQGRRALLLVDEAQNLPLETIEELRMLSNFQQAGKPLLQSFLLGQEELQPILRAPNMEQFRQRIVASCHLAPLTLEEVQSYIEYRLQHAGWNGTQLFSTEAYEHIYKFTRGVPRKINTLMDRILLYGFLEELEVLDETAVDAVIDEVREEMFVPDTPAAPEEPEVAEEQAEPTNNENAQSGKPQRLITPNGNEVKDAEYYKAMLGELVDALDDAISHKIKLTQYIDKLLKKKYRTYVRLKSDD